MTWTRNPDARKQVMGAMSYSTPTTAAAIATLVHKSSPTVNQMLKALAADGVVQMVRLSAMGRGHHGWKLTGKPLPSTTTSTSAAVREEFSTGFDHRLLQAAWPPHLSTTPTLTP